MGSEALETSRPAHDTARIELIYCVAKPVIKGSRRIVTLSLCTPIMAKKLFNALFWPLPRVTASGGHQESSP